MTILSSAADVSSPLSTSPIFDEVDRWWRGGGGEPRSATMLTFSVGGGDTGRVPTTARAAGEPRHLLARTTDPPV
jgi:hypothetical protein